MAFCGEVNDRVRAVFFENGAHGVCIGNISFFKDIVGFVFNIFQVLQIACVGECIEVNNRGVRQILYKFTHDVRTDEAGAAGDEYGFHF